MTADEFRRAFEAALAAHDKGLERAIRLDERAACARELEAMAKEQEINDSDHGRSMRGALLVAAERLRSR